MVNWTNQQKTAFFTAEDQMAMSAETRERIETEGMTTPVSLGQFNTKSWENIVKNLRKPPGELAPFHISQLSIDRMEVMIYLVRQYQVTGRDPEAFNMKWTNYGETFLGAKNTTDRLKEKATPDIPKVSKALPILKWKDSALTFFNNVLGVRDIPLAYVIRKEATPPHLPPPLMPNKPYSGEFGSCKAELIARASHENEEFQADNAMVFNFLDQGLRESIYVSCIDPFRETEDGRGAFLAIVLQHAGDAKYALEHKRCAEILANLDWKGSNPNYPLASWVNHIRSAYVSMQSCEPKCNYGLPSERKRVEAMLDHIICQDGDLKAAISNVRSSVGPNGMMENFEEAAAFLMEQCPIAKKRAKDLIGGKRVTIAGVKGNTNISATDGQKSGTGRTGVALRFHTKSEYAKLTTEQRTELREWRLQNPQASKGKKRNSGNSQSMTKAVDKAISAALAKRQKQEEKDQDDATKWQAAVMSVLQMHDTAKAATPPRGGATAAAAAALPPPPSSTKATQALLNKIMSRAPGH